jgi:ribosomal protein S18 acetylase RimI-like enzyme
MELERIYVVPEYQGKGIGADILKQILIHAKEWNKKYLWLGVWEHNPKAISFYQRHGFQKFGEHPYFIGNDKQTDWLLRLDL